VYFNPFSLGTTPTPSKMPDHLSDDDSIHLHTPPKGRGKCCAGHLCTHPFSRYFESGLCSDCKKYGHDKDCIQVGYDGNWFPGALMVCVLCVQKKQEKDEKAIRREKRKIKDELRKVKKQKADQVKTILKNTTPFNFNTMQKVLKEKKLK
jgi:hypothetical protein